MHSKKKLKFAIIGCGKVAIHHAIAIKKLGHEIVYGSTKNENSINWKSFKKIFPLTKFLKTEKILERKDIDRIVTCLPVDEQIKYCEKLLSSKKPILIEKPLHINYIALKKILTTKNLFLKNKAIAYNRRQYEVVNILKNKIKKSLIKSVDINISENYDVLKKKSKKKINKFYLFTGSTSHILDLSLFLFGKLKILNKWQCNDKKLKSTSLLLNTNKKFPIFVKINSNDPENASIKVRFIDHTLWSLCPIEKLNIYNGNKIIKSRNNFFNKEYKSILKQSYKETKKLKPGFLKQMKNFSNLNFKELVGPQQNLKFIKLLKEII